MTSIDVHDLLNTNEIMERKKERNKKKASWQALVSLIRNMEQLGYIVTTASYENTLICTGKNIVQNGVLATEYTENYIEREYQLI